MNKVLIQFLKSYPNDPKSVDRLIVSAFVRSNGYIVSKNKLILDHLIQIEDEDYESLADILAQTSAINFEELIEMFESVISPSDKIVTGAVYTPPHIRSYIIETAVSRPNLDMNRLTIADISCGCGSFLLDAARKISSLTGKKYSEIISNHIFGLDIADYAIQRTKLILSLLALSNGEDLKKIKFNLFIGDALTFEWQKHIKRFEGFGLILGNPPYVCSRNLDSNTKKNLEKWDVSKSGHPDLYIPFFQIGLESLSNNGFLGFITMNTFFKSINGRALRAYLQAKSLKIRIIDFGSTQIFSSKSTYTCLCFIENQIQDHIKYQLNNSQTIIESKTVQVPYSELDSKDGWNFQSLSIVNKIQSVGAPFKNLFQTSNGIATLKNHIYIFDPIDEDEHYYYLQTDKKIPIEKKVCRDVINSNKVTRVNNVDEILQKIIFPYEYIDGKAVLYAESDFKNRFPKALKYLRKQAHLLSERDKGNGNYENWFAFGRNQSLNPFRYKLFFPHLASRTPNFVFSDDANLLFYNGLAVVSENENDLKFLQKLMSSRIFWFYIVNTSKPYGSGYYSLSRNYIKNFGVCDVTDLEKQQIIEESDLSKVDAFFNVKYGFDKNLELLTRDDLGFAEKEIIETTSNIEM